MGCRQVIIAAETRNSTVKAAGRLEDGAMFADTDRFRGPGRSLGQVCVCLCVPRGHVWIEMTPVFYRATQTNSASYPQRDGKGVPAKVR